MTESNYPNQPATQGLTDITPAPFPSDDRIQAITTEIQQHKKQVVHSFLQIGKLLDEAKGPLKKEGKWLKWLALVGIPERMAQRYMQLARAFPDPTSVSGLGMTKALALLALPESQREDFINEPHKVGGEQKTVQNMSVREVRRVIHERINPVDEAAGEASNFLPVIRRERNTHTGPDKQEKSGIFSSPPDLANLTSSLKSTLTHLDCILVILEKQTEDSMMQSSIAPDLYALQEKVLKCLSLANFELPDNVRRADHVKD